MTHAECQDLLLDLAYGELDAVRAAEVQSHLAGCADCQRGQAQIVETRRMASPLRALEEPSARFDARILAAARAEASMQSDGLPGQVIEVKGSVSPMGLTAARIDSHAFVAAPPAKRKPRWALRVALGGSVAAAAALALVMSTTVQLHKQPESAARYEISTGKIAEKAQREAMARAEEAKKPAYAAQPAPAVPEPAAAAAPPPPVAEREEPRALMAKKSAKAKAVEKDEQATALLAGSGGDAADELALRDSAIRGASGASAGMGAGAVGQASQSHGVGEKMGAPAPATAPVDARKNEPAPASAPAPVAARAAAPASAGGRSSGIAPASTAASAKEGKLDSPGGKAEMRQVAAVAPAAAADVNAGALESQAQEARHAGNYVIAASLYRKAAALRHAANAMALSRDASGKDSGTAAWDLAHAVECLAAAGLFDEARQVRVELMGLYPAESTPIIAANRALRSGDLPSAAQARPAEAVPAAPQQQQQPLKARDDKRQDSAPPADH